MLVAKDNPRSGYFPEQKSRSNFVPEPGRYDFPSARPKRVYSPRESMLLCGLLLCLIIISVGIISQYGRIVAGNYQLQQMRREITLLQEEREYLRIEVKRLSSLERIETIAINELGLQYPEKRQWLILSARGN
ncbi:MAG: cell division protein FtsL [Dethiobacter sp.]|nr:MAG: cell division protein FtsL [Dethiobacter sp.]